MRIVRRLVAFVFHAPLGRCALPLDVFQRLPLGLGPGVAVAREHGARDVPGDAHDHLGAGARLCELRDQGVTVIVPPSNDLRVVADLRPRRP